MTQEEYLAQLVSLDNLAHRIYLHGYIAGRFDAPQHNMDSFHRWPEFHEGFKDGQGDKENVA